MEELYSPVGVVISVVFVLATPTGSFFIEKNKCYFHISVH